MTKSKPNCEACAGIELWPENHDSFEIYQLVRLFGQVSFKDLDSAAQRLGVTDVTIFSKLLTIHREFEIDASIKKEEAQQRQKNHRVKRRGS